MKVNEDKTGLFFLLSNIIFAREVFAPSHKTTRINKTYRQFRLLVLGDGKARRRMMRTGGDMEMELAGNVIRPKERSSLDW